MKKILKLCYLINLLIIIAWPAAAQLNINFIAVNPSETESDEIEVKYYLPKELEPDDVLETGPLALDYDLEKNSIYAHAKISFEPKESKTFKLRVNDVWRVSPDEIQALKDQLALTLSLMKDDVNYESALYVSEKIEEKLDYILKRQADFSGNIERRIEEYRANNVTLEEIRDNIYSIDFLKFESKGIQEQDEQQETIKMIIEVKNPSLEKSQKIEHKHFLPREVRATDLVNQQDFELRFDAERGQPLLWKEEEFSPGETKRYEIVIKDVWNFSDVKLQDFDGRAQIAMLELKDTNFAESANRLYEGITESIQVIRDSQVLDTSTERHIGLYRLNTKRFEVIKQNFKRIEEMISIVRAKKLQDLEKKKVKNVLERLKALRGLKQLADALFRHKLSMNVTWKIIFGTMGFVAFFTTMHFIIWAKRSRLMGEDMAGAEGIKEVPKPGENKDEDDDDE